MPTIWKNSMSLCTPMPFMMMATGMRLLNTECFRYRPFLLRAGCEQTTVLLLSVVVDDCTKAWALFFASVSTMIRFARSCSFIMTTRSTPLTTKYPPGS